MRGRVFYEIADLCNPAGPPFVVLAIYPDERAGGGCMATIKSFHNTHEEAVAALRELRPEIAEVRLH